MYRSFLFMHWKQIRFGLIPFVLAAFALPLLAVEGLGGLQANTVELNAYRQALGFSAWLPFFPVLAACVGITLALSAWNWDHQLKHVYALSLPIPRWRYALLKMSAGAVLVLVPTAAFGLGCLVATLSVDLPSGLHAYPAALTLRFLLAALLAYAAFFAMAAGTIRTTVVILSSIVVLALFSQPITNAVVSLNPNWSGGNVMEWVMTTSMQAPGPLQVYTGNWSLIDV